MKGPLSHVGRYRLLDQVARGGMATVYRGVLEGAEGFARPVAVKVLHPELAQDPEYVRMFQEEARIAARLEHPACVPVRDLGSAEGVHFLVMDLVEGETLASLAEQFRRKDKPFPRGHALHIAAQTLEALHYAHELIDPATKQPLGLVHRDVSPRNVIVERNGRVRILDFGIARTEPTRGRTLVGVVKGTVPYMAPEQARGSPMVDRRADLFAVGMLLHELITGTLAIEDGGTDVQRQALAEGRLEIDWKRIHLGLRPLLVKALAKNPEERFATAQEMAEATREKLEELEPEYDPAMLVALVQSVPRKASKAGRSQKPAPTAVAVTGARRGASRVERPARRAEDGDAPGTIAGSARAHARGGAGEPIEWAAAPTMALFGATILVAGLIYTFMNGSV